MLNDEEKRSNLEDNTLKVMNQQLLVQKISLAVIGLTFIVVLIAVFNICAFIKDANGYLNGAYEKISALDVEKINETVDNVNVFICDVNGTVSKADDLLEGMDSAVEKTDKMLTSIDDVMEKTNTVLGDLQEITDAVDGVKTTVDGMKNRVDNLKSNIVGVFKHIN